MNKKCASRSPWLIHSKAAEGLARCESEERLLQGCRKSLGDDSARDEREGILREGRKTETGFSSVFARLQRSRGRVGLDVRKAELDAENTIKKEEPLSWTVLRWRCSGCCSFLIYQESGKI